MKRVYVYGFHAGVSGGMCRDVIVVGGNRAAQQGVLHQTLILRNRKTGRGAEAVITLPTA